LDDIEFSYLDPTQDDTRELDGFVQAHPEGSAYHLSAWCRAVGAAYGYRSQVLVARRGGRLAGMLPLCVISRPFGSARWVSLPFCDLGGPLAEDDALAAAMAARARADLGARQPALNCAVRSNRGRPSTRPAWRDARCACCSTCPTAPRA
jgi:CelD/BcsL family acetyltransferase involved in cellulose biosynthesis